MKISNAIYLSPNIRYDAVAQVVIVQRLNPDTGEVTFQTPSRAAIREEHAAVTGAPRDKPPQPSRGGESSTTPSDTQSQAQAQASPISILV